MTRVINQQNRRGIALVISLIAMVVIGALVTGIFSSAMLDQRTGEGTRRQNQAFAVADAAAGEVVAGWNTSSYNNMANGASVAISGTSPNATGTYTGTVTRINTQFFLVDIIGKDRYSGSRQRVGLLVKLRILTFDIRAGLTERGSGSVSGSATISGVDTRAWSDCPPAGPSVAGIRSPDAADISFGGACHSLSCISGSPQVQNDVTVNDNTFFSYGNSDWAALASSANITIAGGSTINGMAPSLSGANCNTASTSNWGEPNEPGSVPACRTYFPIIYVNGDLHVTGGRGQGVLLINGDFDMSGGFAFDGVVIARGHIHATGTGTVTGGVMAANVDLEDDAVLGNPTLQYSSCAVQRAATGSSPGAQLKSRGWLQVY